MAPFLKTAAKMITVFGLFAVLAVAPVDPVDDCTCLFDTSVTASLLTQADDDGHHPKVKSPDSVEASSADADVLVSLSPAPLHDDPIPINPSQYIVASGIGRAPPTNA